MFSNSFFASIFTRICIFLFFSKVFALVFVFALQKEQTHTSELRCRMAEETPLVALENDGLDFRKEVEENLKKYGKMGLKARATSEERAAYREAVEEALRQLEEHRSEAEDLIGDASGLRGEDEPAVKAKEFQRRVGVEVKRLRETLARVEKGGKKLRAWLEGQAGKDLVAEMVGRRGAGAQESGSKGGEAREVEEEEEEGAVESKGERLECSRRLKVGRDIFAFPIKSKGGCHFRGFHTVLGFGTF